MNEVETFLADFDQWDQQKRETMEGAIEMAVNRLYTSEVDFLWASLEQARQALGESVKCAPSSVVAQWYQSATAETLHQFDLLFFVTQVATFVRLSGEHEGQ